MAAPVAFLSYVRFDDDHDDHQITQLRERLSREVRAQTGEAFEIFQDRKDIRWGEQWQARLDESLDSVTFLIPILTPGFFRSSYCREELEQFLAREKALGRGDLILPVYYITAPVLDDAAKRENDALAKVLATRQRVDWRELRFESFTNPQIRRKIAEMAGQIVEALERVQPAKATTAPPASPSKPPVNKSEPPVLIVDPFHRGDYVTISEAIAAATPGTRIMVRPGLYEEGLIIDKPLEIVGDGDRSDIVIRARNQDAVWFKTTAGRVANLILRQTGKDEANTLECYGVDISQGRLVLEDCDITSHGGSCVAIRDGADPRVRRNRIHDGKDAGIYVYTNGMGVIEDNDVFANAGAGVVICTGGNPTLRHNRIHDGKSAGILVHTNGLGMVENNDIFANTFAGIEIKGGDYPTLRHNRIHDGKDAGIYVYDHGLGVIEDNDIFANDFDGVQIQQGSNPTLRKNRIYDGKDDGIYVFNDGLGMIEDNDIFANASDGITICLSSNPNVRHNRINQNKELGVFVHTNGGGTIENNDLRNNGKGALSISANSLSKVKRSGNIEK